MPISDPKEIEAAFSDKLNRHEAEAGPFQFLQYAESTRRAWAELRAVEAVEPQAGVLEIHADADDQCVYFITDGEFIKIGVAVDPQKRLNGLQTGNPRQLRLLGTVPGGTSLERGLHACFQARHVHGEWFRLTEGEAGALIAALRLGPIEPSEQ
jgi:hypothetical protein